MSIVDANLIGRNDFITGKTLLIMSGDAAYEDKGAASFDNTTGIITPVSGFSAQIKAGTLYKILNISSVEVNVKNIDTKIGTNVDPAGTTTLFAWLAKLFAQGGQGLVYYGKVTTYTDTTHFKVSGLAGFGNDYFNNFRGYVVRDAAGGGAAPQGEMQPVSDYVSSDGTFVHTAFTVPLAVDDEVLILHPRIAEIKDLIDRLGTAADAAGTTTVFARLKQIVDTYLASGTIGLAAIKTVVDAILVDTSTTLEGKLDAIGIIVAAILVDTGTTLEGKLDLPAADATENTTVAKAVGNKEDTPDYTAGATASSLIRLIKGILGVKVVAEGTLTTSSPTVPADTGRTEGNDFFKGCILMPLTGAVAFQPRPIRQFTSGTDVFTLDEPFTAAPGLVAYVILASDYPVQRLIDIFNAVNAILTSAETGGTVTTDGTEQDVYRVETPAGVFEPLKVKIDFTNQTAGETVVVKTYYRIKSGGNLIKEDETTFAGVQDPQLKPIDLEPNRYGLKVTMQRTAGVARDYDWEALYRA
jgi:hypothetical protein